MFVRPIWYTFRDHCPFSVVWFMVFNTLSAIFQLYRGSQFYWWRILQYLEKTTDLSQVT